MESGRYRAVSHKMGNAVTADSLHEFLDTAPGPVKFTKAAKK
jgi:hypothetical protein